MAGTTPQKATMTPPMPGPTERPRFQVSELMATAAGRSSRETMPGTMDWRAGWAKLPEMPVKTARMARISMRIQPVVTSRIRMAEWVATTIWVIWVRRTRSMRSAMAPAKGETMTEGARLQKARMPTQRGEWVSSQASQSTAICWIQMPVQQVRLAP